MIILRLMLLKYVLALRLISLWYAFFGFSADVVDSSGKYMGLSDIV